LSQALLSPSTQPTSNPPNLFTMKFFVSVSCQLEEEPGTNLLTLRQLAIAILSVAASASATFISGLAGPIASPLLASQTLVGAPLAAPLGLGLAGQSIIASPAIASRTIVGAPLGLGLAGPSVLAS